MYNIGCLYYICEVHYKVCSVGRQHTIVVSEI